MIGMPNQKSFLEFDEGSRKKLAEINLEKAQ
jgi:hypothetical protein